MTTSSSDHASRGRLAWSTGELAHLRGLYESASMAEVLQAIPGRTRDAVLLKARKEDLRRPTGRSGQGTLSRLLEDDPVAAYWMGFLMADGHFSANRMTVTIAAKDEGHIRKLAIWLGPAFRVRFQRGGSIVGLSCQEPAVVTLIRERFDLHSRKTYVPPMFLPYDDDRLLTAWLIGFVDGDGRISKQSGRRRGALASVVSHMAWMPLLRSVSTRLGVGTITTRSGGVGGHGTYAALTISAHSQLVRLKGFAKAERLPVLDRKWDRVDETFIPRTVGATSVTAMIEAGVSSRDIIARSGSKPNTIYAAMRRHRNAGAVPVREGKVPESVAAMPPVPQPA